MGSQRLIVTLVTGLAPGSGPAMGSAVPYVAQLELADCAAACLAMTLAYHGRHVPLEELRDATGTGRNSRRAGHRGRSRRYGLMARGVKAEIDDLACLPRGSVLHWNFDHFVVFRRSPGRA